MMIIEGSLFWIGASFIDGNAVVSVFINEATGSLRLAGLAAALRNAAPIVAQFLLGMYIAQVDNFGRAMYRHPPALPLGGGADGAAAAARTARRAPRGLFDCAGDAVLFFGRLYRAVLDRDRCAHRAAQAARCHSGLPAGVRRAGGLRRGVCRQGAARCAGAHLRPALCLDLRPVRLCVSD